MCIILFLSYVGFSNAILNNYDKYYEISKLNYLEAGSYDLYYTYNFEQGIESQNYDFQSSTDPRMKSLKIGGEFLAGCAGEVIPGFLIALMMANESSDYYKYGEWDEIHQTNLIGSVLLVAPLTWGTAKLLGEDSSFWKTIIGAIIGSLAATLLWEADAGDNYSLELYYLFLTPLGACIGANL
jgi:uncharacterized membrane protein YeaQ/YmgE (transglycosylase-associated protein family)